MARDDFESSVQAKQIYLSPREATAATQLLGSLLEQLTKDTAAEVSSADSRQCFATKIYESRRIRHRFIRENIFAEPAWDILLLMYGAHQGSQPLSVSAVCHSTGVAFTTGLRWLERLEGVGLIERRSHPTDGRVMWVSLTDKATAKLDDYFDYMLSRLFKNTGG